MIKSNKASSSFIIVSLIVLALMMFILTLFVTITPEAEKKKVGITSFSVLSEEKQNQTPPLPESCNEFYSSKKDKDRDGIMDQCDNCPDYPNPEQEDKNNNGIGDVCEFILAGVSSGGSGGGGGSITITCFVNSDCGIDRFTENTFCLGKNVSRNFTAFSCNFPGTGSSFCINSTQQITNKTCNISCLQGQCLTCNTNTDCGIDRFVGENYCINNNVTRNYVLFSCNNSGTLLASCSNTTQPILIQQCINGCLNGQCLNISCFNNSDCNDNNNKTEDVCLNPGTINSTCTHNPITCFVNSDCGIDGFIGNRFCTGKNVTQNFTAFSCNAPGQMNSFCSSITTSRNIQTCQNTCSQGQCISIACNVNSDCGTNFLSENLCSGNDVTKNFVNHTCNFPGTPSSFCSNQTGNIIIKSCSQNQTCISGECKTATINCISDLECGITGFVGENFCSNGDVYKNFQSATCINPGTFQSKCNINTSQILIRDCNDNNPLTNDFCIQPQTGPAFCQNVLV